MNQWNLLKRERLLNAIYEANRFISKAQLAADEIEQNDECSAPVYAAAKRSSMDLTRSLAVLRSSLYGN